jgi:transcriptional regulator with XRE-family HTH domain
MSVLRPQPRRIGPKILAIRQRLGLSQTQMKHRINFPGDYGRISDYELGKRVPTILTLLAYARAANIPLEQIVDDALELKF